MMKNKKTEFFLMVSFLILEIINFKHNYSREIYTNLRSIFWIWHFVIAFFYIISFDFIMKSNIWYYDIAVIFFPCLGILMMMVCNVFEVKEKIEDNIAQSFSEDKIIDDNYELNFYDDLNTIGAYDSLLVKNAKEKKKFLYEFNPLNIAFKVKILQKALLDDDIDVIHYSATELNKIDVKLQEKVKSAEKKGNLKNIYKAYKEYINSGLLMDSILDFYQEKILKILSKLVEEDKKYEKELLELYIKMGKKLEYEQFLRKTLNKESSKSLVERLIKFLYGENRYREMLEVHKAYNNYGIELPVLFNFPKE